MISSKLFFGIIIILAAYFYDKFANPVLDKEEEEKKNIVEAWQSIVKVPEAKFARICVG